MMYKALFGVCLLVGSAQAKPELSENNKYLAATAGYGIATATALYGLYAHSKMLYYRFKNYDATNSYQSPVQQKINIVKELGISSFILATAIYSVNKAYINYKKTSTTTSNKEKSHETI